MGKRVLIVEDEAPLSTALAEKMRKEGYEAEVAKNGQEGLEAIKRNKPDIILLDVIMPIMDGMSMLRNLRTDNEAKDIPVIILSNLSDSNDILQAMQNNTYDYLIKSDVTLEVIVDRIKSRIGWKQRNKL